MRVSSGRTAGEVVLEEHEDNQDTGSTEIKTLQIFDKKCITIKVGRVLGKKSISP